MALQLPGLLPSLETLAGRFVLQPFSVADVVQLSAVLAQDEICVRATATASTGPQAPRT